MCAVQWNGSLAHAAQTFECKDSKKWRNGNFFFHTTEKSGHSEGRADVMRGQGSEVRSQPVAGIEEEHFGMNRNKQKTPQAGTIWMPAAVPGGSSGMAVKTGMRQDHETQTEPTLKRKVT